MVEQGHLLWTCPCQLCCAWRRVGVLLGDPSKPEAFRVAALRKVREFYTEVVELSEGTTGPFVNPPGVGGGVGSGPTPWLPFAPGGLAGPARPLAPPESGREKGSAPAAEPSAAKEPEEKKAREPSKSKEKRKSRDKKEKRKDSKKDKKRKSHRSSTEVEEAENKKEKKSIAVKEEPPESREEKEAVGAEGEDKTFTEVKTEVVDSASPANGEGEEALGDEEEKSPKAEVVKTEARLRSVSRQRSRDRTLPSKTPERSPSSKRKRGPRPPSHSPPARARSSTATSSRGRGTLDRPPGHFEVPRHWDWNYWRSRNQWGENKGKKKRERAKDIALHGLNEDRKEERKKRSWR